MALSDGDLVGFKREWQDGTNVQDQWELLPSAPLRGVVTAAAGGAASVVWKGVVSQVGAAPADIPEDQLVTLSTAELTENEGAEEFNGQTVEPQPLNGTVPPNPRSSYRGLVIWVGERTDGDDENVFKQVALVKTPANLFYVAPTSQLRVVQNA